MLNQPGQAQSPINPEQISAMLAKAKLEESKNPYMPGDILKGMRSLT